MKSELNSQYSKGCLILLKAKALKELSERTGAKMKMPPTKLVGVLKKKANELTKKSRIVACGNMDDSEDEKETYAGGADATAV